ncbi:MAG: hypothetical protein PQJ60_12940 [Spirochaetales bacterium]|nr:hypothetical protein [Spirochaetales bacterium]
MDGISWLIQGELDFGRTVAEGYLEQKEGLIFSLIRELCPVERISFRPGKGQGRRQFKVQCPNGRVYWLSFTDSFLYTRNPGELKGDLLYNLDYIKRTDSSARILFGKGSIKFKDL